MTTEETAGTVGTAPASLRGVVDRARAILLKPRETWEAIAGEPATARSIFIPYVVTLAAIGPIAGLIGGQVFGYGAFGFRFRPSIGSALGTALLSYVLTLVGVFVLAWVINALAPRFGGRKDLTSALKVAAYSGTAAWIAGIFGLVPALAILGLLGLYSLYLLYLGLSRLMQVPQDKSVAYTIVTILAAGLLFLLVGLLSSRLVAPAAGRAGFGSDSGTITTPGGGELDLSEAGGLAGMLGGMAQAVGEDGEVRPPVPAAQLKALLPDALPGLPRASNESGQMAIGSRASADYGQGEKEISLSLTDLGVAGALTAMAPEMEKESNGAYERTGRVNGRLTTERYDSGDRSGEFGILVGGRVMVQAEGRGVEMNELKAALARIDLPRLERLVR